MKPEEFIAGWTLLVIQPWGKRYAGTDTAAKLQKEFYWNRLSRFHGEAWKVTCELFASGDHWPNVDEFRHAINNSLPERFQITQYPNTVEKPEILVKIDIYQAQHECTMLEAAQVVMKEFAKEHPGEEFDDQINRCEALIKTLKAHRAHIQVLKQEREANHA